MIRPGFTPRFQTNNALGKIRIVHSLPNDRLPDGIVLRAGVHFRPGWFAVTPNGVGHRQHCWHCALRQVQAWLINFRTNRQFWSTNVYPTDVGR